MKRDGALSCTPETAENQVVAAETGQKSDSMFATIIRTALFLTILFTLFWTEFFQYSDALLKLGWEWGIYLKRIHNKITQPMCCHYCFFTDMRPTRISSVPLFSKF